MKSQAAANLQKDVHCVKSEAAADRKRSEDGHQAQMAMVLARMGAMQEQLQAMEKQMKGKQLEQSPVLEAAKENMKPI